MTGSPSCKDLGGRRSQQREHRGQRPWDGDGPEHLGGLEEDGAWAEAVGGGQG